jgi:hypothetical protein
MQISGTVHLFRSMHQNVDRDLRHLGHLLITLADGDDTSTVDVPGGMKAAVGDVVAVNVEVSR